MTLAKKTILKNREPKKRGTEEARHALQGTPSKKAVLSSSRTRKLLEDEL